MTRAFGPRPDSSGVNNPLSRNRSRFSAVAIVIEAASTPGSLPMALEAVISVTES